MAAPPALAAAPTHGAPLHAPSYCPENVQHNLKQLFYIRSVSLSLAGSTAGVLGLTNTSGFLFYALSVLLINALILLLSARAKPGRYLLDVAQAQRGGGAPLGLASFALQGAQDNLLSYVLWWTFWYGIVHVYD